MTSDTPNNIIPLKSKQTASCPICQKTTAHKYRPFCSKRCADVDLGRWFQEDYRVPVSFTEEEAETNSQ